MLNISQEKAKTLLEIATKLFLNGAEEDPTQPADSTGNTLPFEELLAGATSLSASMRRENKLDSETSPHMMRLAAGYIQALANAGELLTPFLEKVLKIWEEERRFLQSAEEYGKCMSIAQCFSQL